MFGLTNKSMDAAPPYEELEAQSSSSRYASVPQVDEEPHVHPHPHTHEHQYLDQSTRSTTTLPAPATFQPHVHCEACDGFLQRQQKMRAERFCCGMVAATFMAAFVCGLLLGVAIVNGRKDKWNH
ncbi:hypothetical protein BJX66DRAFT_318792 [Aspergillus keveii]|uniref:LITAF domain-containing protein n=1 Tax=Aspergillus keveii TaxID=714993 RepID=A0ABR4FJ79_9EURO